MGISYWCNINWHDHCVIENIVEYLFKYFKNLGLIIQPSFSIKWENLTCQLSINEKQISFVYEYSFIYYGDLHWGYCSFLLHIFCDSFVFYPQLWWNSGLIYFCCVGNWFKLLLVNEIMSLAVIFTFPKYST